MIRAQKLRKSPSRFLATAECDDMRRIAHVNIGRRFKNDEIKKGLFKNDRATTRQKTHRGVKVGIKGEKTWVNGILNNISTTGAMITLTGGLFVSSDIILYDEETGYIIPCMLARSAVNHIGIKFTGKKVQVYPKESYLFTAVSLEDARKMLARKNARKEKVLPANSSVPRPKPSR